MHSIAIEYYSNPLLTAIKYKERKGWKLISSHLFPLLKPFITWTRAIWILPYQYRRNQKVQTKVSKSQKVNACDVSMFSTHPWSTHFFFYLHWKRIHLQQKLEHPEGNPALELTNSLKQSFKKQNWETPSTQKPYLGI